MKRFFFKNKFNLFDVIAYSIGAIAAVKISNWVLLLIIPLSIISVCCEVKE